MTLSELIKRRRSDRGMTLREVEAAGGTGKSMTSSIEIGELCDLRVSDIVALSRALKLKPEVTFAAAAESLK